MDDGISQECIWKLDARDEAAEQELAEAADIPVILASLLRARGVHTPEAVKTFLQPSLEALYDPMELPDMRPAAERVIEALADGEPVLIHGDFDADGITATALLVQFLSRLGGEAHYYVPHRVEDGYGLIPYAVEEAVKRDINLIITVDCGVTNVEEISRGREMGAEFIIIDHHLPGPELPDALVVDPKRTDYDGPDDDLAAVGLAYKFAEAICRMMEIPLESVRRAFFDLVAIGTVADVVPLVGENRIFVKYGLQLLPHTRKPGLTALMNLTDINGEVSAQDISYRLAPRLNACGRMADASDAIDLILAGDEDVAMKAALDMEGLNNRRQREQETTLTSAQSMIAQRIDFEQDAVIVLESEDWHAGIIGIVASRLVEEHYRPVFLMTRQDDVYRGSARSIEGFHVANALQECSDLLQRHGGHALAGGFTVPVDRLPAFRERLNDIARRTLLPQDLKPTIRIDAEIPLGEVDENLVQQLRRMEPFGHSNPEPVFMSPQVEIVEVRQVGREGKHLKLLAACGDRVFDCIGFNMGDEAEWIRPGRPVDLAYTPEFNEFNGRVSLQLRLADLRPADTT
ncbi:MAG: single-stranded-DNA-specific exonuclease RecJ [Armatimonadota bacterium]